MHTHRDYDEMMAAENDAGGEAVPTPRCPALAEPRVAAEDHIDCQRAQWTWRQNQRRRIQYMRGKALCATIKREDAICWVREATDELTVLNYSLDEPVYQSNNTYSPGSAGLV